MSLKTTEFVTNKKMFIIFHPPYLLDLGPCDFTLSPKLKMELKGWRFETVSDIQRVLGSIKENDFHSAFEACKMMGLLYMFPRRLFWRRWQSKLRKLSQHFFFDLPRELSDSTSYSSRQIPWLCISSTFGWTAVWSGHFYKFYRVSLYRCCTALTGTKDAWCPFSERTQTLPKACYQHLSWASSIKLTYTVHFFKTYSKLSLIRINWEQTLVQISESPNYKSATENTVACFLSNAIVISGLRIW
jgi:hypothetical protein